MLSAKKVYNDLNLNLLPFLCFPTGSLAPRKTDENRELRYAMLRIKKGFDMSSKKIDDNSRKENFWTRMDNRQKIAFTMIFCALALILTAVLCLLLIHPAKTETQPATAESASESLVTESGYNKDQNTIDTAQYTSTILEKSEDAGQQYVDDTLFLGDSNTARMYRLFDFCTYDNAIGSVGMAASSLKSFACAKFSGLSGYKTMPEAVAIMQPQRVIITFGTNDLSPSLSDTKFIQQYQEGIQAVQDAYPSVDIIINSIPPLGQEHSNSNLTQAQVDAYNKAIVQMCQEKGWKYLNSAEALKDSSTGYAKNGYVISSDGIHMTQEGMSALFDYIRTHSYITEDDRLTLKKVPTHTEDKDVTVVSNVVTSTSQATATEEPVATAEPTPEPTETTYTYWDEVIEPTYTEQGYTIHHCNEDDSKTYTDSYTAQKAYTYWDEVIAPTTTSQGYTIHHCNEDDSKTYTDTYTDMLPSASSADSSPASSSAASESASDPAATVQSSSTVNSDTTQAEETPTVSEAANSGTDGQ